MSLAAASSGAQPTAIPAWEERALKAALSEQRKASLERWGVSHDDIRTLSAPDLLRATRIAERREAMVAAAAQSDPLARYLVQTELKWRCAGNSRFNRAWCERFADWVARSQGIEAGTGFSHRVNDLWFHTDLARIGDVFYLGVRGPRDEDRARKLYQLCHDRQLPAEMAHCAFRLGQIESDRFGGGNPAAVIGYYAKAAGAQHPMAAYLLGNLLVEDPARASHLPWNAREMTPQDYFSVAAEGGVADAQYRFAQLIEERIDAGKPVRQDEADRAFTYFGASAKSGHVPAMRSLARFHRYGWGRKKDEASAETWYTRAARAGDAEASWILAGITNQRGDHQVAFSWVKRAAEGGYPGADKRLAEWRAEGWGEANLGNSLLSVISFLGEAAGNYNRQKAEELAVEQARARSVLLAISQSGSSANGANGDVPTIYLEDISGEQARHDQDVADFNRRIETRRQEDSAKVAQLTREAETHAADQAAVDAARIRARQIACYGEVLPAGPPPPGVFRGSCQ